MGVRKTETCLIIWSESGTVSSSNTERKTISENQSEQEEYESIFAADAFYDAGDQGCGEGPLGKIAALMRNLEVGQTLEVRATDPTVAVDLPAWCRLTGHVIADQRADRYLIRKG